MLEKPTRASRSTAITRPAREHHPLNICFIAQLIQNAAIPPEPVRRNVETPSDAAAFVIGAPDIYDEHGSDAHAQHGESAIARHDFCGILGLGRREGCVPWLLGGDHLFDASRTNGTDT